MRLALAGVLLAALSSPASAAELVVTTFSHHLDEPPPAHRCNVSSNGTCTRYSDELLPDTRESFTPGLGLAVPIAPRLELVAGAYSNSHGHGSRYLVASYELHRFVRIAGGYLDGYERPPLALALVGVLGPLRLVVTPRPAVASLWIALPL